MKALSSFHPMSYYEVDIDTGFKRGGTSSKRTRFNMQGTSETRSDVPGSEDVPGGGHGQPTQYFLPENPGWTGGAWWLQSSGPRVGHD